MSNNYPSSNPIDENEYRQWQAGVPKDYRGAFAVITDNGCHNIVWDGTKEHSFQCVIAWVRIPERPLLQHNPRAGKDDHGAWVGNYSFDPNYSPVPEVMEKVVMGLLSETIKRVKLTRQYRNAGSDDIVDAAKDVLMTALSQTVLEKVAEHSLFRGKL